MFFRCVSISINSKFTEKQTDEHMAVCTRTFFCTVQEAQDSHQASQGTHQDGKDSRDSHCKGQNNNQDGQNSCQHGQDSQQDGQEGRIFQGSQAPTKSSGLYEMSAEIDAFLAQIEL